MFKKFVIMFFWFGFCWLLIVPSIVLNGHTGYPKLQEHEILLMWLPPLLFFLPMLCLSLQRIIFGTLSGFYGLFFRKAQKEEINVNGTFIKTNESKIFSDDVEALFVAVHKGLPDRLKTLIQSKDVNINATSSKGVTALILAIHRGHTEIVRLLLEAKADVNVSTKKGLTALFLAAHKGHTEIIRLLLEAKADVNVTIKIKGETYTLLKMIIERHKETINLLKDNCAAADPLVT